MAQEATVAQKPQEAVVARQKMMPRAIRTYVRVMDKVGYIVGIVAMVQAFTLMFVLVESSVARVIFGASHIWSVEMAQFVMSAYYLLGGALSEQDDYHVRMDLWYSRLSLRKRAIVDSITVPMLLFYLLFLFIGAIESSAWAVSNNQVNFSPWAPPMAPIKIIMAVGIGLMFFQATAIWFKNLAYALGRSISEEERAPGPVVIGSQRKKRAAAEMAREAAQEGGQEATREGPPE
jgi:TRAP-type C4-dicarboxylate transport system permease small subunit